MGEGNALSLRTRHMARRDVFVRAAAILAETAADPQEPGRVRVGFDLVALTGWAPAENQQKPLRPGSARMSLADALAPPASDDPTPDT